MSCNQDNYVIKLEPPFIKFQHQPNAEVMQKRCVWNKAFLLDPTCFCLDFNSREIYSKDSNESSNHKLLFFLNHFYFNCFNDRDARSFVQASK